MLRLVIRRRSTGCLGRLGSTGWHGRLLRGLCLDDTAGKGWPDVICWMYGLSPFARLPKSRTGAGQYGSQQGVPPTDHQVQAPEFTAVGAQTANAAPSVELSAGPSGFSRQSIWWVK
eukprot:GHUV01035104.1.p1 GENE.GHUV01035104.1~~GHUV01035104.1.p1  ORF type:complete len:117 (-),score=11.03 GHUV01035104.1:275-625(-)